MNQQYKELLREILDDGYQYVDKSRNVQRKQITHKTLEIDLKQGFPAINLKKLYWKGVVAELLWFLRGDTNIKYLIDNGVNIWNKDALNYCNRLSSYEYDMNTFLQKVKNEESIDAYNKFGDLGRIYGAQWRDWTNIKLGKYDGWKQENLDQISNLIKNLKEKPLATDHIVTAWNPAELDDMALPPCHWSFEIIVKPLSQKERINYYDKINKPIFYVVNKKIDFFDKYLDEANIPKYGFDLVWEQRSVDTFLG